jgi:hypothetical protein
MFRFEEQIYDNGTSSKVRDVGINGVISSALSPPYCSPTPTTLILVSTSYFCTSIESLLTEHGSATVPPVRYRSCSRGLLY